MPQRPKARQLVEAAVKSFAPVPEDWMRRGDATVAVLRACQMAGLSLAEARTRNRRPEVVVRRNRAFWLLRQRGWSLPRIGQVFGRDHTTVLHSVRRAEALAREGESGEQGSQIPPSGRAKMPAGFPPKSEISGGYENGEGRHG